MKQLNKDNGPAAKKFFILKALALKTPYHEIKTNYQIFFEEKINGEAIIELEASHRVEIKKIEKSELGDMNRRPMAHPAVRLDFIYKGLQDAITPKALRSYKVSDTEYEVVMGIDHNAVTKYLALARAEDYEAKRLLLDMYRNDVITDNPAEAFKPVAIEDGMLHAQTE